MSRHKDFAEKFWDKYACLEEHGDPKAVQALIAKLDEMDRAYGDCQKCYGKGYSTAISHIKGYPDFIGDKGFKHKKPIANYYDCDRGKQYEP